MIEFNKDLVTEAELIDAAQTIFNMEQKNFEKIKNEKWYQTLFHAITLNQDGKKYMVKGIHSLAKLQRLFMELYINNYRKAYEQLDSVIEVATKNSNAINKIYGMCVLKLEEQPNLTSLDDYDSDILALFLGEYRDENGDVPEQVKKYNRGVLNALNRNMPVGNLDSHQIRTLRSPKVVYRCFMEQCAIDHTIDSQDWSDKIYDDLKDFELSENTKAEIKSDVKKEVEIAGEEYFLVKYTKENNGILDSDFIIDLISTPLEVPQNNYTDKDAQAIELFLKFKFKESAALLEDGGEISTRGLYLLRYIYNWDFEIYNTYKAGDYVEQGYLREDTLCSVNYARTICSNKDKAVMIMNNNMKKLNELCESDDLFAKYEYILAKEFLNEITKEEVEQRFKEIIDDYPIARFVYARRCYNKDDKKTAFSIFLQPIYDNFAEALYYRARYYEFGYMVEKNIVKANELYKRAIDLGGKYCCNYIHTYWEIDTSKQGIKNMIDYAVQALKPYLNVDENVYTTHEGPYGQFQDRWEVRKKYNSDDESIAYYLSLFLQGQCEFKKAADALCLAASLNEVMALLDIIELLTIKHKGILLGTFIDDSSYEQQELKRAFWEFDYNLGDARKLIKRVERLELTEKEKDRLKRLKEKVN